MIDRNKIINFDFQGWPMTKMNLRDILESIGAKKTTDVDGNQVYAIADDSKLDLFPVVLQDDGMGYGVNEEYVIEFSVGEEHCNIFREKELENIDVWLKYHIGPGHVITLEDASEWYILSILKENDEYIFKAVRSVVYEPGQREERAFTEEEIQKYLKRK